MSISSSLLNSVIMKIRIKNPLIKLKLVKFIVIWSINKNISIILINKTHTTLKSKLKFNFEFRMENCRIKIYC